MNVLASLVTSVVSLVLTFIMGLQWVRRRRTHALWWGISFLTAAVAALLQFLAFSQGAWPDGAYRTYVVAAAAVPALMGAGTLYLLWRRMAAAYVALILVFIALTFLGVAGSTLTPGLLDNVMAASAQPSRLLSSPLVAIGFGVLGGLGGAALVLGALWSYARTRMPFNLGIAAGGVIFSLGDTLAALGTPALFFLAEIAGIVTLFLAVRASQRLRTSAEAVPQEGSAR